MVILYMQNMNNIRPDTFFQQFRHWDLNLLVVLEALYTEQGNVTKAAQRVGLSQSAMSHALNRLRDMLGDPLFVKQGHRMQATARANALAPQIASWLELIRTQLNPPAFDPATIQQEINIAIPEHLERIILPSLLRFLRQHAPGLHLHSRPVPIAQLPDFFAQGRIDMAITGNDWDAGEGYSQQLLIESGFVYIYDANQLHFDEPVSFAALAAVPQLASNYSHKTATIIDNYFTAQGYQRRIMATAGGINSIPAILMECPMLSILPEIMIADHPLFKSLVMKPFEPEKVRATLHLVWHRLHEHDDVNRFVRDWIIAYFDTRKSGLCSE
jgi:LysR family transcriptional activator of mexEF-oprN operon